MDSFYDVIVLGGGAAGLMCAAIAGQRGRKVLVLEVSNKLGKKILMSGGGRCNFTNLDVTAEHFICDNPHFVKSALSQYSQWDFIALAAQYEVAYHEKAHGQLFCDHSAKDILAMLVSECEKAKVEILLNCETSVISKLGGPYQLQTSKGNTSCASLVVATGGLSIPTLGGATGGLSIPTLGGATGLAYQLAKQFELPLSNTEASLVPMTLTGKWHEFAQSLSGVSLPVVASVKSKSFSENLLFTHRGLSGPSIIQLSNYWHLGEHISIDLLPAIDAKKELLQLKKSSPNQTLITWLSALMPTSLAQALQQEWWPNQANKPLQEIKNAELELIAVSLNSWQLKPSGTEGYRTAEVTRGGVSVSSISSKTMQVEGQSGLFFIGEALDVTGHLGGYNFQWAWSSGYVAGMNS